MEQTLAPGQIIILNGAPRSGKSSIIEVIQDTFDGVWMNLGVDGFMQMTPARYLPGMGLRPGHHDAYAVRRGILPDCARRLSGLPVLFVGVRCPIETIMDRRRTTGWETGAPADAPAPRPVLLWQREVHTPGIYDLEVDTSVLGPEACAALIRRHLDNGPPPSAFRQLAAMRTTQN